MDSLYITTDGKIKGEGNTIYFVNEKEKRSFPVQNIKEIVCMGQVSLTSGAISYLLKRGVPVHFFNRYGNYEGSLFPKFREYYGEIVVRQAEHYLDYGKRMYIARQIVDGLKHNILKNLRY
ncbi:CRISPR-associated endonuclease Cas1, partial [Candidatus Bathyarchaeota archaeon ex4484_205]